MTGRLSDYDQGLLDQIGLFADTRIAEQVRAVMVARNNAEAQLAEARDIYSLRESGLRVLDEEQCCELACSSGACESCPCCQAGWCVWGHSAEIPERDLTPASNYRVWLDTAIEHNPVAELLAEIEGVVGIAYDEPIAAALSATPQPEPDVDVTRLIDPELAHGWQSSEKEMRKLRADLAAAAVEPAKCEHRQTKAHHYFEDWTGRERRCPGPAAGGAS